MQAIRVTLEQVFNKGRLIEIPFFQRSYVWTEENWERFLKDYQDVSNSNKEYFMGTVILKAMSVSTSERIGDKRILVDGQQRLTTITLFFKAWTEIHNDSTLMDTFFNRTNALILKHNHNDIRIFEAILNDQLTNELIKENKDSGIWQCYSYFMSQKEIIKSININTILNQIYFVGIDLAKDEDEQQIFDTINSLGVSLTAAELLKNELFSRDDEKCYEDTWKKTFEVDNETIEYWEADVTAGRQIRTNIDILLQSSLLSSTDAKDKYIGVDNLYKKYKLYIEHSKIENKDLIDSLMKYARIYSKNIQPELLYEDINKNSAIERLNIVMFGLNISTAIPYILFVLHEVKEPENQDEIFSFIESYLMRRLICKESTKNYNNLFTSLIRNKITTIEDLKKRFQKEDQTDWRIISETELEKGFYESKLPNQHAKVVLYLIEKSLQTNKDSTTLLPINDYTLEHMMPKKWRNHWSIPKKESDCLLRDESLLTLGNLTIITASLNSSIRDANWDIKKNGNKKKDGLKAYSKGIRITDKYLNEDDWNESTIHSRANFLYLNAKKIW